VRAGGPTFLSLPGYYEIFSGVPSRSCYHNGCARIGVDTFVDDAKKGGQPSGEIAAFASWKPYGRAVARDPTGVFISAGQPPGSKAPPYPGWGDYRPDIDTARAALDYLRTVRPRMLIVGLGDADEHAHRGEITKYRSALTMADDILGELSQAIDGSETAVIVTTDHGRADSLRGHGARLRGSDRVFVAAFGARIARRGITCADRPIHLADIAPVVRILANIAREGDEETPLAVELLDR
jgi:arylsulfatase A-like enzyme